MKDRIPRRHVPPSSSACSRSWPAGRRWSCGKGRAGAPGPGGPVPQPGSPRNEDRPAARAAVARVTLAPRSGFPQVYLPPFASTGPVGSCRPVERGPADGSTPATSPRSDGEETDCGPRQPGPNVGQTRPARGATYRRASLVPRAAGAAGTWTSLRHGPQRLADTIPASQATSASKQLKEGGNVSARDAILHRRFSSGEKAGEMPVRAAGSRRRPAASRTSFDRSARPPTDHTVRGPPAW